MPNTLFDLSGTIAMVSGSSAGLGRVIAGGLARAGAAVVLNGRNEDRLAEAVDAFRRDGLDVSGQCFDVTCPDSVQAGITAIEARTGKLDILVNNAGIQRRSPLETMAVEDWQAVIETNLTGPFLLARCVAKGMIQRRAGKIVNICSLMSEVGRVSTGNYAAAKGGLKMLTRAMAVEWAKHNIQCNAIAPGYFLTDMTRPLAEDTDFDNWLKRRTPAGRWGRPEELIGAAVFLASEASSFVNGQMICVDGGVLASL